MKDDDKLVSRSGAPIWRYDSSEKEFQLAIGDEAALAEISDHIEKHVGPIDMVWHEVASHLVHIDLHHVRPSANRNFNILITSGMSDKPMNAPPGAEGCEFAELLITLPSDWPVNQESFQDDSNYWPIRMIKDLARLPHEYDSWLWWAHSVGNGDPPEPYHTTTRFCSAMLAPPLLLPEEFFLLETKSDRSIAFFSVIPLYPEELRFKLNQGADALFKRFEHFGVTELIDPKRQNTCASWWQRIFSS